MRSAVFAFVVLLGLPGGAHGDEPVERARRALADGLPQAAIPTLRDVLENPANESVDEARLLLGRALLAARRPEEAREVLLPLVDDPDAAFWLAQAEAGMGNALGALKIFTSVVRNTNAELQSEAVLAASHMLVELGRRDDAIEILRVLEHGTLSGEAALLEAEILLDLERVEAAREAFGRSGHGDEPSPRSRLLEARLALAAGEYEEAFRIFDRLSRTASLNDSSLAALASIGAARARVAMGQDSEAERQLEAFIDQSPSNPQLARVFGELDALYGADGTATNSQLEKWVSEQRDSPRRAYALFHLAKNQWRNGDVGQATDTMQKFIREYSQHRLRRNASELLARWFLEIGEAQYALNVLDQYRGSREEQSMDGRLLFLRAEVFAAQNEFALAARDFRRAGRMDRTLRDAANRNARLFELRIGMRPRDLASDYDYAAAMELARQRDAGAGEVLENLRGKVSPEREADLMLARAELEFDEGDFASAGEQLIRVANEADQLTAEQQARADYLAVFLEESSGGDTSAAARDFLERNPNSLFEAEVRMKLGETLYARGDFTAARLQFATAARQTNEPALRETALFMAAQAARKELSDSSRDDAIAYFEEIAQLGGRLAGRARLEQAMLKAAQNDREQAEVILTQIIENSEDSELVAEARLRNGDLMFESASEPERYREAGEYFSQVAKTEGLSAPARNEALTKAGLAYEKAGDPDHAVARFYEVLDSSQEKNPDLFWYYKAGFEVGRLLENRRLFKEAVAVYEKLSQVKGPRSNEARERVNRLRLENLLWEDSP